ncbi:MAG: hypothetical protein DI582_07025 [Azospirillum brasilense]|nr:MAG: hypothetical protein DI582_07025 [Azospirillum brasilense]
MADTQENPQTEPRQFPTGAAPSDPEEYNRLVREQQDATPGYREAQQFLAQKEKPTRADLEAFVKLVEESPDVHPVLKPSPFGRTAMGEVVIQVSIGEETRALSFTGTMAERFATLANTVADSALIPLINDAKELQAVVEARNAQHKQEQPTPERGPNAAPEISALPASVLEQVAQAAQQFHGADSSRAIPAAKERGGAEQGIG